MKTLLVTILIGLFLALGAENAQAACAQGSRYIYPAGDWVIAGIDVEVDYYAQGELRPCGWYVEMQNAGGRIYFAPESYVRLPSGGYGAYDYAPNNWEAHTYAPANIAGTGPGCAYAQNSLTEYQIDQEYQVRLDYGPYGQCFDASGPPGGGGAGPTLTLTASNTAPLVNSDPVTVTAQYSGGAIETSSLTFSENCPKVPNTVSCTFNPTQVGQQTVSAVYVNLQAAVDINVLAQQESGTFRFYVDVDGSFNPSNPSDDSLQFSPGYDLNAGHVGVAPNPQQVTLIAAYVGNQSGQIVPPPQDVSVVRMALQDTTHYEGYAMNAGDDTDWDYGFNGQSREQFAFANFGTLVANQARLTLSVYDYGGSTKIRAFAQNAQSDVLAQSDLVGLPSSVPNTLDNDSSPGSNNPGDGITALEEWRGFMVQGQHIRTNPISKDLFVTHEDANIWNIDLATAGSLGVNYWIVALDEVQGTDNYINFKSGNLPDHRGQKALRIVQAFGNGCTTPTCNTSLFGRADPIDENMPVSLMRPNNTIRIRIWSNNIRYASPVLQDLNTVEAPDQDKTNQTLAHEIGHSLGLEHFEVNVLPCPMSTNLRSVMAWGFTRVSNGTPPNNCAWNNIPTTYKDDERSTFKMKD